MLGDLRDVAVMNGDDDNGVPIAPLTTDVPAGVAVIVVAAAVVVVVVVVIAETVEPIAPGVR